MFEAMLHFLEQRIYVHGVWVGVILFLVVFLESLLMLGYFVPAVAILVFTGGLIAVESVDLWPALIGGTLGALVGSTLTFWMGRRYGERLWQTWPLRNYPHLVLHGLRMFERHRSASLVLGRFSKPLRSVVPAMAGAGQMSTRRFMTLNSLSVLVWSPACLFAGMGVGLSLEALSGHGLLAVALVSGMLMGYWLWRRYKSKGVEDKPEWL